MNENMKTYLKSAKQMIANGGICGAHSRNTELTYIFCMDCFYAQQNKYNFVVCGGLVSDVNINLAELAEKHVRDAKAFIAKYTTPVYIELEES